MFKTLKILKHHIPLKIFFPTLNHIKINKNHILLKTQKQKKWYSKKLHHFTLKKIYFFITLISNHQ